MKESLARAQEAYDERRRARGDKRISFWIPGELCEAIESSKFYRKEDGLAVAIRLLLWKGLEKK